MADGQKIESGGGIIDYYHFFPVTNAGSGFDINNLNINPPKIIINGYTIRTDLLPATLVTRDMTLDNVTYPKYINFGLEPMFLGAMVDENDYGQSSEPRLAIFLDENNIPKLIFIGIGLDPVELPYVNNSGNVEVV